MDWGSGKRGAGSGERGAGSGKDKTSHPKTQGNKRLCTRRREEERNRLLSASRALHLGRISITQTEGLTTAAHTPYEQPMLE